VQSAYSIRPLENRVPGSNVTDSVIHAVRLKCLPLLQTAFVRLLNLVSKGFLVRNRTGISLIPVTWCERVTEIAKRYVR
jgi:hypothetical protein